jgi:hypothetical protein
VPSLSPQTMPSLPSTRVSGRCHMQLTTQRPKTHTTGTPKDPSQNLSIRGKKKGIRGLFSFPSRIIPRTIGTQEPAGSASASPPTTPYYVRPTSVQCSFHFHSSTRVSIRTRQCLDSKFKIPKVSYQMVTLIRRIKYRLNKKLITQFHAISEGGHLLHCRPRDKWRARERGLPTCSRATRPLRR